LFFATPVWTVWTISGRIGEVKTYFKSLVSIFFQKSALKTVFLSQVATPSTPHFRKSSYLWERVAGAADSSVSGQDRDSWAGSHLEVEFVVELKSDWR